MRRRANATNFFCASFGRLALASARHWTCGQWTSGVTASCFQTLRPSRTTKRVFLPAGQMDLPGEVLLWAKEHELLDNEPVFFSRKRTAGGARRVISRQQAWEIVRAASELANVRVLALRTSQYGVAGERAPVHPHLFRHARVRQLVRTTNSLPIAQKQAGWSRLQMAYLTVGDEEVRSAMRLVDE